MRRLSPVLHSRPLCTEVFIPFPESQSSTIGNVDGWQRLLLFDRRVMCVPTHNVGCTSHVFRHWVTVFSSHAWSGSSPLHPCANWECGKTAPIYAQHGSPSPTRPFSSRDSRGSSGHCRHARRTVIGFSRLLSFPRGKSLRICKRRDLESFGGVNENVVCAAQSRPCLSRYRGCL